MSKKNINNKETGCSQKCYAEWVYAPTVFPDTSYNRYSRGNIMTLIELYEEALQTIPLELEKLKQKLKDLDGK